MVFGIWCGSGKPTNLNEFLTPFVNEMNAISRNGVMINDFRLDVSIRSIIADSPARSFLKGFFYKFSFFHFRFGTIFFFQFIYRYSFNIVQARCILITDTDAKNATLSELTIRLHYVFVSMDSIQRKGLTTLLEIELIHYTTRNIRCWKTC